MCGGRDREIAHYEYVASAKTTPASREAMLCIDIARRAETEVELEKDVSIRHRDEYRYMTEYYRKQYIIHER